VSTKHLPNFTVSKKHYILYEHVLKSRMFHVYTPTSSQVVCVIVIERRFVCLTIHEKSAYIIGKDECSLLNSRHPFHLHSVIGIYTGSGWGAQALVSHTQLPTQSTTEQHASLAAKAEDHMICPLLKHTGKGLLQSKSKC
jgi:hypothetical protein